MAPDTPVVTFLMVLTFIAFGAVLHICFRALFGTRHWHETGGVVLRTKTSSRDSVDSLLTHNAHLFWEYGVGQHTHSGEMVIAYASSRTAQQVIDTYQPGTAVKVYFNPKKPTQSTLRIKNPGTWALWIVTVLSTLGVLCMIMAAGYLLFE